mgnify:FL=1|jgi:hypothetical protein
MNDPDKFSDVLRKTAEISGETEDVKILPKAHTINPGKQWIKLIDVDEVK